MLLYIIIKITQKREGNSSVITVTTRDETHHVQVTAGPCRSQKGGKGPGDGSPVSPQTLMLVEGTSPKGFEDFSPLRPKTGGSW